MMFCVVRGKRAGFTLIEIMIVIAIIGILAGIAIPNFVQARQEANYVKCKKTLKMLAEAAEMYLVRKGGYGIGMDAGKLVEQGYAKPLPWCPFHKKRGETSYQVTFCWVDIGLIFTNAKGKDITHYFPKGSYYTRCYLFGDSATGCRHVVGKQRIAPVYSPQIGGFGDAYTGDN